MVRLQQALTLMTSNIMLAVRCSDTSDNDKILQLVSLTDGMLTGGVMFWGIVTVTVCERPAPLVAIRAWEASG